MKVLPIKNYLTFGEIEGDGGYFSMRNLGKTDREYYCELKIANAKYLKKQQAELKAHNLERLNKSVEGKTLNFVEKLIYNLKKMKIKLL